MSKLWILVSLALPGQAAQVAGSVVRSREWIVRRSPAKEEEFIGDVRYESAGLRLRADRALYRHAERRWTASGDVQIRRTLRDDAMLAANGASARFDEATRSGVLEPLKGGRVTFSRTLPGEAPDVGDGGRILWTSGGSVTIAGGARIGGPRLAAWADEAVYDRDGGRLDLTGSRPVLERFDPQWTTALKADAVYATEKPRRIDARGRVVGWIVFRKDLPR